VVTQARVQRASRAPRKNFMDEAKPNSKDTSPDLSKDESKPNSGAPSSDVTTEIAVLKARLQMLQDGDKRVAETMRLSLTVLISVITLFAGYNWFSGKQSYDRERESMRTDVELLGKENALALEKELGGEFAQLQSEFKLELDSQKKMNQLSIADQLSTDSVFYSNQVSQLSNSAYLTLRIITDRASTNIAELATNLYMTSENLYGHIFLSHAAEVESIPTLPNGAALTFQGMAVAADSFLHARREQTLQTCIDVLRKKLPLLKKSDFDELANFEMSYTNLLFDLRNYQANGRYDGFIQELDRTYRSVTAK